VSELSYSDIRSVLAKVADLDRDLVLVGGQAVNFWASVYQGRVPALAREGPFASKDIDFCGDRRAVRLCAERLNGTARLATLDDATVNAGTVIFEDGSGERRTLDVVAAPFGLNAKEVRDTALRVEILDDGGAPTGASFHAMHPVLSMESRVHNVAGLPKIYDTNQGRKQLRASIVCAHEFLRDVLDGRFEVADPARTVLKLNERVFRFCIHDRHAKELVRTTGIDPALVLVDDVRLPPTFRERRLAQMREQLATRPRGTGVAPSAPPHQPQPAQVPGGGTPDDHFRKRRDRGPERG
jgi:hypothetical protein